MGIRDLINRLPGVHASVFKWQEPKAYRIRLRGDWLTRIITALAAWAMAIGLLLLLFAVNVHKPGFGLAVFLGAVAGLGPAMLFLFFLSGHVSGKVTVSDDRLFRRRTYGSLTMTATYLETANWCYESIDRCVVVPGDTLGKSFSVMFLVCGSSLDMIGVPESVDLLAVVQHLKSKGVLVERGKAVPAQFTRQLAIPIPIITSVLGGAALFVGLTVFMITRFGNGEDRVADGPNDRREQFQKRQQAIGGKLQNDFRPPRLEAPRPPLPGARHPVPPTPPQNRDSDPTNPFNEDPVNPFDDRFGAKPLGNAPMPEGGSPSSGAGDERESEGTVSNGANPFVPRGGLPDIRRPGRTTQPARETGMVGGTGGGPFESVDRNERPVIGVRYSLGSWAGTPAIRQFDPLFSRDAPESFGDTVWAREGYAVGALTIDAESYVTAVQIEFMRLKTDGRLDPSDSYTADWIGRPTGSNPKKLGGTGTRVIGFRGRRAAVFDALGIVLDG